MLIAKDLDTLEALQKIGGALNVEALVTGTLVLSSNQFALNILVRSVQDARLEATASEILSSLDGSASHDSATKLQRAGVNGVGTPACVYCPPPDYSDKARAAKRQGAVLLDVVVTLEGKATRIILVKGLGEGLDEKAIEAVKSWRFKPVTDSAGNPITVLVAILVTFRLRK
jgi:TonB family protein